MPQRNMLVDRRRDIRSIYGLVSILAGTLGRAVSPQDHPDYFGSTAGQLRGHAILLVDAEGTLIFYNEPAEAILNQRFGRPARSPRMSGTDW
jgi:hypothetical protein